MEEQPLGGIVCVGFSDWDNEVWTNQHHLMARLSRERPVLFVESLGLRRPTLAGRDLRRVARRLRRGLRGPRPGDPRNVEGACVEVISPLVLPWHHRRWLRRLNAMLLRMFVRRAARRLGLHRPVLWGYVPQAEALLAALDPRLVVYHCVDDVAAHERIDRASFDATERRFAARADLVLASSAPLAERLRAQGAGDVRLFENVADTRLFSEALRGGAIDPALAALQPPRLVFCGAIATAKLDLGMLGEVADARPQWSIALIGPVGLGDPHTDPAALSEHENIHLLGTRSQAGLPAVLRGADVALIPYARNELTDSIFPMKVYEYLAAGVPTIATRLPSLQGVDDIEFADSADETVELVERLIAQDGRAAREGRSQRAQSHSWERRVAELERLLAMSR